MKPTGAVKKRAVNRWIRLLLMGVCVMVVSAGALPFARADDSPFATTQEEIIRHLSTPSVPCTGRTRSFLDRTGVNRGAVPKGKRTLVVVGESKDSAEPVQQVVVVQPEKPVNRVNMLIPFAYDSSMLQPAAFDPLDELGRAIASDALASRKIIILGHTDSDGTPGYNLNLSLRRAQSVRNYLVGHHGVSPSRLTVMGYGEEMPIAPNTTPENKQRNRRVEIRAE